MSADLSFRPITPEDDRFLAQVYASTRQEELQIVPWSETEKAAFLQQQFTAQHRFYQEQFTAAEFLIVLHQGQPIGRLYVDRRPNEISIIDIALLPAHRNQGIGSTLLRNILAEAQQINLPVRIHVEQYNPAQRWYTRFGFTKISDYGVYELMEWVPPQSGTGLTP
jgi:ribosomal protein S18 acetylase RimI-like enzyme